MSVVLRSSPTVCRWGTRRSSRSIQRSCLPSTQAADRAATSAARRARRSDLRACPKSALTPSSSGRLAVGSSAGAPKQPAWCVCSLDVGLGRFRQHSGPMPPAPSLPAGPRCSPFPQPGHSRPPSSRCPSPPPTTSTGARPTSARSSQRPVDPICKPISAIDFSSRLPQSSTALTIIADPRRDVMLLQG